MTEPLVPYGRYNQCRESLPVQRHRWIYVCHSGLAVGWRGYIRESGLGTMNQRQQEIFAAYAYYKLLSERKRRHSAGDILVAHHVWSAGYHHWIADVLVSLSEFGDTAKFALLAPADYPSFAFESLEAWRFREVIRLPARTGAFVRDALVLGHQHTANFHPDQLKRLRERLLVHAGVAATTASGGRRLYVSRRSASVRRIANEDELLMRLRGHGFDVVQTEQMSFWDQVSLFAQCDVLVSNHGAGLTNMLFMPPRARVVEIIRAQTTDAPHLTNCYRNMAEALGLRHTHVQSPTTRSASRTLPVERRDVVVDVATVERALG